MTQKFLYDIVIIGGFGHVGLPLGIALANCGYQVGLYDLDRSKRSTILSGKMPFLEYDAEPILRRVIGKQLHLLDEFKDLKDGRVIFITVGTPVDARFRATPKPVLSLAHQLGSFLSNEQCVILRSTVYPGVSRLLFNALRKKNRPVHLAYCPERIVQGYAIRELKKLPQIVSGFSPQSIRIAKEVFSRLGVQNIEVKVEEAEFAKLFLNSWRYIQFAIANQFYMMATDWKVDFNRIYHAMTHRYERAKSFPRPGFAAGPCLLKDTMQLASCYGKQFRIGQAAMSINDGLPNYLIGYLRSLGVDLRKKKIGILGMAFKADTDDVRDSLMYKMAALFKRKKIKFLCSDEFVKDRSFVSKQRVIRECSVIVIGAPHSAYKKLKIPRSKVVIDLWSIAG